MSRTIDYYISLVSPWTYLGGPRLAEIAHRHRIEVAVKPVDIGNVFAAAGGLPLRQRPAQRQAYRLVELERWRAYLKMPLNLRPAFFPVPDRLAGCAVIAAARTGADPLALAQAILAAVWAEERNVADAETLIAIADSCGIDGRDLLAAASEPATQSAYEANTEEAIQRGIFGVPSYVYRDEIFWGQDRLDFLDRALAG